MDVVLRCEIYGSLLWQQQKTNIAIPVKIDVIQLQLLFGRMERGITSMDSE